MTAAPDCASTCMRRIALLFFLLSGISFFDHLKNAFTSRNGITKMKDAHDVKGLIRLLNHSDPDIRYEAADALGRVGDTPAIVSLIEVLKTDESSGVRWKAAEALARIGMPSVESLIAILGYPDDDVRWKAAIALGEIRDPRSIDPLISLLSDEDRFVTSRAAYALGMIGEPAVEPLIQVLRIGDGSIRRGAAIALGQIRDVRAVEPLIRALADTHGDVRVEAATSLAAIGEPAVEPLIRFLKYTSGDVRGEVIMTLGALHRSEAIEPILQLLEDADEEERRTVADALDAIITPVVEPQVQRLPNGHDEQHGD